MSYPLQLYTSNVFPPNIVYSYSIVLFPKPISLKVVSPKRCTTPKIAESVPAPEIRKILEHGFEHFLILVYSFRAPRLIALHIYLQPKL